MLANIQRGIAAAMLAIIFGFGVVALHMRHSAWAFTVPILLVLGYAAGLALEFRWLSKSYTSTSEDRPTSRQLFSAWVAEVAMGPRTFLWRQPFRTHAFPDRPLVPTSGGRGVLFVHGFFCNRAFWNVWMARFAARGTPFVSVSLEPVFGSIDEYAHSIESAVQALTSGTGRPPIIVAHSMGGLACRAWLAGRVGKEPPAHVVTIGTPHRGTWMARHSRSRNGTQMRIESEWLADLVRKERESPRNVAFTCFWGHCDNIVFPTRNATLPEADNRHVPATPHIAMAFHRDVMAEVDRLLEA